MSVEIDLKEKLENIVWSLFEKGAYSEQYKVRLTEELNEINAQMEQEYFINLYENNIKFAVNENNLFIVKLLGIVKDFNINETAKFIIGEFPDVDTDYMPDVRDYMKNVWAPKTFGASSVCGIGSYTTFGIKSSLIDMAKVHDKSRSEILDLTTKIGLKDEDGKALTWESALEAYPLLKKYCEDNPEVADASKRLLNRNRGTNQHAGGLIIANQPIDNLVPMIRNSDGQPVSAFVEGLHGTDLGPLGLIKIDALSLIALEQLANCVKIVKERHNLKSICALPNQADWSDVDAFLNDKKSLQLANEGKLKCIFQFDSEGIRELIRSGGATSFEDIPAYSALYRPGPLNAGMGKAYVERKRGREKYEIHPLLKPILGYTYGVMIYQEQILKILSIVGDIPDMHCEIIRKAISKKKVKIFARYKDMFIRNGQKKLNWTESQVSDLWSAIEAFSEYGFNRSHSVAYAYLSMKLLWFKAHYPLEFFAATLKCEKNEDKIKEYKYELETFNITIEKLDINKSKERFAICDDKIYIGFSNIKGVGDEVGLRIVANQPYNSFENFLEKFGTESKVITPLIVLKAFEDDPKKLYEYYTYYKDQIKKNEASSKRFIQTKEKLILEISIMIQDQYGSIDHAEVSCRADAETLLDESVNLNEKEFYVKIGDKFVLPISQQKELWKIIKKYQRSYNGQLNKSKILLMSEYEFTGEVPEDIEQLTSNVIQFAEEKYYGFAWLHLITTSPDYSGGHTFSDFDADLTAYVKMCEIQVVEQPKRKKSAKGTVYWTVKVEDANNRIETVQLWDDDYQRFKEELEFWDDDIYKGNFLRIRLKKPEPPWKNYQFDAPFKQNRWREVPKEKADDSRIQVMARLPKVTPSVSIVKNVDADAFVKQLEKKVIII